jgi:hypothetical protein
VHYLLTHPGAFVKFLSVYLARPFFPSFTLGLSLLTTGLLVAMVLLGALYLWLRHRDEFATVLPWLCVGAYAVLAGTATATGRLTDGPQQAESSRYTTISQLLAVAALVVAAKVLQVAWTSADRTVLTRAARFVPAGALAALALILVVTYLPNVRHAQQWTDRRKAAAACAATVTSPTDDCLLFLYPDKTSVFNRIEYLRSIGWR